MSEKNKRDISSDAEKDEQQEGYLNILTFYQQTENPIAAWAAISYWSLKYEENPQGHVMPRPLLDFLRRNSLAIMELAEGHKPPVFRDGKLVSHKEPNALSPSQALDFLPEALHLRGYKWNAFDDISRFMKSLDLLEIKWAARGSGKTEAEAMEIVSELAGVSDPRTARRKLKGWRGPRQKSPYPTAGSVTEGYIVPASPAKKPKTRGAKKP